MGLQGIAAYAAFGPNQAALGAGSGFFAAQATSAAASGPKLSVSSDAAEGHKVDATFAAEMVRRIAANYVRPNADAAGSGQSGDVPATANKTPDGGQAGDAAHDPTRLADSLTNTLDYLRSRFGETTATAFMGIVAANVGAGAVDENSMGQAMLSGIRMIDANFGINAGNEFMNNLNAGLNGAVNAYFDDGQNQVIFATTSAGTAVYSRLGEAARAVMAKFGEGDAKTVMDLIKASLENGKGKYDLLRGNLAEAVEYLRQKHGQEAGGVIAMLGDALSGDQAPGSGVPPGTLVDLTA